MCLQINSSWQQHDANHPLGTCSGTHVLLYTLSRLLMRHTKAQVVGGQAVSELPPKTEEAVAGETLPAQARLYHCAHFVQSALYSSRIRGRRSRVSLCSTLGTSCEPSFQA